MQQLFIDLLHRGRTDVDLPYLFRAATHRCLNRLRDRRRRQDLLDHHGDLLSPAVAARIDDRAIHHETLTRLVATLDDRSAEILVLHFVDGVAQGEVAAMIGVSRRAVVKRIGQIRAAARAVAEAP